MPLLFAFEYYVLCSFRDFVYLAVGALWTSNKLIKHDVLRNRLRVWVNTILHRQLHSPSFDSDSHDSVFYRVENRLELSLGQLRHNASFIRLIIDDYSKSKSQIRAQITNKTVAIERVFAIFCSSAFFILRNITLSDYLRANNNDDIPCVVFELEYVMSTSSRKDDRSSISLPGSRSSQKEYRFHTFTPVLRLVTCLVSYVSTFCLLLLLC